jgi:predicted O-methyltransferase YrrM
MPGVTKLCHTPSEFHCASINRVAELPSKIVIPPISHGTNTTALPKMNPPVEGQLSSGERKLLSDALLTMPTKPQIVIEVGTWLGGGSTLHILRALQKNGEGHLWGVEAVRDIYEKMISNLQAEVPEALDRFTPLFGFSDKVLPEWLSSLPANAKIDLAFLDGGDSPGEQIEEFKLLAPHIKVGGILMSHDAKLRKGKWIVPYVALLDNWESRVHDLSEEGLHFAQKTREKPSEQSLRTAERKLAMMRFQPVELMGRILPKQIRSLIAGLMPSDLAKRLFQGRK